MKRIGSALVAIIALSLMAGCPSDPTVGDVQQLDSVPSDSQTADLPPGQICIPGDVKACVTEGGKEALICNASGTAFLKGVCKGDDGSDSQCINGDCTKCFPGIQVCQGDNIVLKCKTDGSGYDEYQNCEEDTGGDVCLGGECKKLCDINLKFNSYIGCDYWGVDLDNAFVPGGRSGYYDAQGAQYAIAIANPPESPRDAVVEIWYKEGGDIQKVPFDVNGDPLPVEPLKPGSLRVYRLPQRNVNGTVLASLAYRVTSSVPIIAYQFNPLENEEVFSNDASLLLPATLLGRDYIVMTREQTFDSLRGYLTVVAVMPGETQVSVDLTAPTMAGQIYPGSDREEEIKHFEAGTTAYFTLEQFDVLNIETDRPGADLTGSVVRADQRVAVFGGSEASNAPNTARCIDIDPVTGKGVCEYNTDKTCKDLMDCVGAGYNTCCADHLEQQMFPVKTWGSHYVASKSWDRGMESDIWRVMAAKDNTQILLIPAQQGINVPILNRGEYFEFESRGHFEIMSVEKDDQGTHQLAPQKPILLGQYLAAQDAPEPNVGGVPQAGDAGIGDPAFMLGIPVQQYRTDFVILVPAEYELNYVNIVAPTGATVEIDGAEIEAGFFEPVGTGTYSVYRKMLQPGAHTITSSEPAGVIVYGYDNYVSYGYTGGLDLAEINKGI